MSDRMILGCITAALATVMAVSSPVEAAPERKLLVLIDSSGSMAAPRDNTDGKGATRFEAAKTLAVDRIEFYVNQIDPRPLRVAVYTFTGFDAVGVLHTNASVNSGFVDKDSAENAIDCLTGAPAGSCSSTPDGGAPFFVRGATPLARAMCEVVNIFAPFGADGKFLQVSSDGEDNSTTSAPCAGPTGIFDAAADTYNPADSWQNQIIATFTNKGISSHADLFEICNLPLRSSAAPDPEGRLTPEARAFAATASATTGLTPLEQFFTLLAQTTGGSLTIVHDDEPLPVIGDADGDRCVDHTDAIPVARAFGPGAPPRDGTFDLNVDGRVDFADYLIQLSLITPNCGKNPYVPRAPVLCKGGSPIVIDSQAIEDGGLTIDARGSCAITIKNSLIVSGQNAITVVGRARITVDNSIIVGQNAVIVQHGGGVLSAGSTIFHGKTAFDGSLQFIDRGGNVFD